jgi:hypothetical protein
MQLAKVWLWATLSAVTAGFVAGILAGMARPLYVGAERARCWDTTVCIAGGSMSTIR